jgi:hypothetical protein
LYGRNNNDDNKHAYAGTEGGRRGQEGVSFFLFFSVAINLLVQIYRFIFFFYLQFIINFATGLCVHVEPQVFYFDLV